jgi:hypothetical protein
MALDIVTTVRGFLHHAGVSDKHPSLTGTELLAAGDLLEWAEDCLRCNGYTGRGDLA